MSVFQSQATLGFRRGFIKGMSILGVALMMLGCEGYQKHNSKAVKRVFEQYVEALFKNHVEEAYRLLTMEDQKNIPLKVFSESWGQYSKGVKFISFSIEHIQILKDDDKKVHGAVGVLNLKVFNTKIEKEWKGESNLIAWVEKGKLTIQIGHPQNILGMPSDVIRAPLRSTLSISK